MFNALLKIGDKVLVCTDYLPLRNYNGKICILDSFSNSSDYVSIKENSSWFLYRNEVFKITPLLEIITKGFYENK